jgi:hypothetical protein
MSRTKLVLFMTAILLAGCGRSNVVYSDGGGITTDGLNPFPAGFYNQSVNQAGVDIPVTSGTPVVRFKTRAASTNATGAFNDSARIGNFALLGVSIYDQVAIADLDLFSFEAKQVSGLRPLTLFLQVDLECDGSIPYVLQATGTSLIQTSVSNGYVSFSAILADHVWTSHGAPVTDGVNDLIPETDSGNGTGSLDDLLSQYPNACISNGRTYDPGFPADLPTAGVLVGLGDADETALNEVRVRKVTIDSDVYTDWKQ